MKKLRKHVKKRFKNLVKRIVDGVIIRFVYDVFKHLFKDDD